MYIFTYYWDIDSFDCIFDEQTHRGWRDTNYRYVVSVSRVLAGCPGSWAGSSGSHGHAQSVTWYLLDVRIARKCQEMVLQRKSDQNISDQNIAWRSWLLLGFQFPDGWSKFVRRHTALYGLYWWIKYDQVGHTPTKCPSSKLWKIS